MVSHTDPGKNDPNQTDLVVNIYDSNFKKAKEVYRQKYYFQVGKPVNGIYLAEDGRRSGIRFFAIPYMKKQGKNQLFIFDLKGKPLKQMDMPEVEETLFSFYPFAIQDGKLYRLVENQDEEWELHVTEIE